MDIVQTDTYADLVSDGGYVSPSLVRLDTMPRPRSPARLIVEGLPPSAGSASALTHDRDALERRIQALEERLELARVVDRAEGALDQRLELLERRQDELAANLHDANQAFRRLVARLGSVSERLETLSTAYGCD